MSRLDELLKIPLPDNPPYRLKCLPGNQNWIYDAITQPDNEVGNWCHITDGNCKRCPMNQEHLKKLVNQYK